MKVLLVFPPQWASLLPYQSVPALTAYLRRHGVEVVQRDLNAEFNDLVLDRGFLGSATERLRRRIDVCTDPSDVRYLQGVLSRSDVVIGSVDEARGVLKTPEEFCRPSALAAGLDAVSSAFALASAAFHPTLIGLVRLQRMRYDVGSLQDVCSAVHDREDNVFRSVLEEHFLESILEEEPDLIGISILAETQVIPGLTLASLIRERSDVFLTIGGSLLTHLGRGLFERPEIWELCDAVVVREGEVPLLRLVREREAGRDCSGVDNLIYRRAGRTVYTEPHPRLDTDTLPLPEFDGFPLDRYLVPALTLPISASRGCPWGRCSFCSTRNVLHDGFAPRRPESVADDIIALRDRYGARHFWFTDECIPPPRLRRICRGIVERDAGIAWASYMRPDRRLTQEVCELAAASGARVLRFGVESACERLLGLMDKGTTPEVIRESLRNSKRAGIRTHVCLMVGFPTETADEARTTLRFVADNRDVIDSVSISAFRLKKGSRICQLPARYGVDMAKVGGDGSGFAASWAYRDEAGALGSGGFDAFVEYETMLHRTFPDFPVWRTLCHEHLFLYEALRRRGGRSAGGPGGGRA